MATIVSKHEILLEKLTLMHIMQFEDIEEKGGGHIYHIQALHNQFNTMSHTWPRNPHDCSQLTTRTPSSQAPYHKNLEPLIVLPQTIQLSSWFQFHKS